MRIFEYCVVCRIRRHFYHFNFELFAAVHSKISFFKSQLIGRLGFQLFLQLGSVFLHICQLNKLYPSGFTIYSSLCIWNWANLNIIKNSNLDNFDQELMTSHWMYQMMKKWFTLQTSLHYVQIKFTHEA